MEPESSLLHSQESATCPYPSPSPWPCEMFRNIVRFYGEELLLRRPTVKLEDHPLSVVWDCLFNILAATLHTWKPFLHPQPEDVSRDRDSLIMDSGDVKFEVVYGHWLSGIEYFVVFLRHSRQLPEQWLILSGDRFLSYIFQQLTSNHSKRN
jgi:hypothetical protein